MCPVCSVYHSPFNTHNLQSVGTLCFLFTGPGTIDWWPAWALTRNSLQLFHNLVNNHFKTILIASLSFSSLSQRKKTCSSKSPPNCPYVITNPCLINREQKCEALHSPSSVCATLVQYFHCIYAFCGYRGEEKNSISIATPQFCNDIESWNIWEILLDVKNQITFYVYLKHS